jgi:hypothetical protein
MGKLRRLTYLSLQVSEDGRFYQAVGRGVLPRGLPPGPLIELHLNQVMRNLGCLALEPSLMILPRVRNLHISAGDTRGEGGGGGGAGAVLWTTCVNTCPCRWDTSIASPVSYTRPHQYGYGFGNQIRKVPYHSCLATILKAGGILGNA